MLRRFGAIQLFLNALTLLTTPQLRSVGLARRRQCQHGRWCDHLIPEVRLSGRDDLLWAAPCQELRSGATGCCAGAAGRGGVGIGSPRRTPVLGRKLAELPLQAAKLLPQFAGGLFQLVVGHPAGVHVLAASVSVCDLQLLIDKRIALRAQLRKLSLGAQQLRGPQPVQLAQQVCDIFAASRSGPDLPLQGSGLRVSKLSDLAIQLLHPPLARGDLLLKRLQLSFDLQ